MPRGNPLKYNDPSGHYAICFQEGRKPGAEAGDKANRESAVNAICSQLAAAGLIGESGKYEIFGSNQAGASAALDFLLEMQELYPDEEFVLLGYSWGGGAALEFARALDSLPAHIFGWNSEVDTMITIDPVVGGRWWMERMIKPANVFYSSEPFENVQQAFNILASDNAYGWITPWDQGVGVPGAENYVLPETNHCTVGHANCPGVLPFGLVPMDDGSGKVNSTTVGLVADFLEK